MAEYKCLGAASDGILGEGEVVEYYFCHKGMHFKVRTADMANGPWSVKYCSECGCSADEHSGLGTEVGIMPANLADELNRVHALNITPLGWES